MTIYVQFSDATDTKIVSVFAGPQAATAFPNQGIVIPSDARWATFYASMPASGQAGLTPPTTPVAPPGPTLAQQAQAALDVMDAPGGCAIRCFKAGVAFPAAWQAYCTALRAIVNGTASPTPTVVPTAPAFPAGT